MKFTSYKDDKPMYTIFLDAKVSILKSEEYSSRQKVSALFNLMNTILEEATEVEKVTFTTLFSRTAFVGNKFQIHPNDLYYIHRFRRDNERDITLQQINYYVTLGEFVIDVLIKELWFEAHEVNTLPIAVNQYFKSDKAAIKSFERVVYGLVESVNLDEMVVYFYDEKKPIRLSTALFDQADKNEIFNENIKRLGQRFELPIHVNFIDVEILSDGTYIPRAMVIDPDYLVDVTAIASCFQEGSTFPMLRIVSRLKKINNSLPLMVGNIANMFLDEIISKPEVTFTDLLPKIFKIDPLSMISFTDEEVKEMMKDVKNHFRNLKHVVLNDLKQQNIRRHKVFLEPSFYSRDFGVQGRLDLFHFDDARGKVDIVELKSGSAYRANVYGISPSHYVQTLLYDLIIKSTFGYNTRPNNFILYSKISDNSLRYAPPVQFQQFEALRVRNDLISLESALSSNAQSVESILSYIKVDHFNEVKGFLSRDIKHVQRSFSSLDKIEKKYISSFVSFIAREQRLSKTGEHGLSKSNGLAAIWLENTSEKEDRFALFKKLIIDRNRAEEDIPLLHLKRTEETIRLANFRVGDIIVLYPFENDPKAVLHNQIFKCTLIEINASELVVRLRSKQYNNSLFNEIEFWNVEPDTLDSGFNSLYRSMGVFMNADPIKRSLWMGRHSPSLHSEVKFNFYSSNLTEEQNDLMNSILKAKDYFLLWGPPGTGKTSVMMKELVNHLHNNTEEKILLLAYTNRAVDEICSALNSISNSANELYIRIGSRFSCSSDHQNRLLSELIANFSTRQQVKNLLSHHRIIVSTVSSIMNKTEIFDFKKFDRVIIDEASQILEPMLIGILCKIKSAVLIGDHRQLPAVVSQSSLKSQVQDESMISMGFTDLRVSLFERLYFQCQRSNWDHAVGILNTQGRMHEVLMRFPNKYFYQEKLSTLPKVERLNRPLALASDTLESEILSKERFIFVPTHVDKAFNWKTNSSEAKIVVKLIGLMFKRIELLKQEFTSDTIGVITPYRAQIALIKQELENSDLKSYMSMITVDTVERYQGGARDNIIISLCTNRMSQLNSLVSLSQDGIDRKLNVAITRAREQLIILGNKNVLETNQTYLALMDSAFEWNLEEN